MIARHAALAAVRRALRRSPVVALVGPRQCGKSTLARQILPASSPGYFDLEDPAALESLSGPMTVLGDCRGVVVIDEVQRRPDLFPVLRVLADRPRRPARFLVLGSASPALLRQSSESLAGRIEVVHLGGFDLGELGPSVVRRHWLRGGFPRSFLARTEEDSRIWRREFVQTFLERDIPQLGGTLASPALRRFWTMVAHYHGNIWSSADPARSLGVSEPTVRRYLDLLTSLFVVRQLQPWHENIGKRQVKSPKAYIRDTGILHELLGIRDERSLLAHPKCGGSWEGYVIETVLSLLRPEAAYFWATHHDAELDLLLFKDGRRIGIEVKRADAPGFTRSMHIAMSDLHLDRLFVIYPGTKRYSLGKKADVVPLRSLAADPSLLQRTPARPHTRPR